jgi:vesicular inhibitory amino acid transporter
MIVINPITKFGLCTRPVSLVHSLHRASPLYFFDGMKGARRRNGIKKLTKQLNITIESILSIQPRLPGDESQILTSPILNPHSGSESEELETKLRRKEKRNLVLRVISRIFITGVCTITAILLPGFGKVMAFLGSFSAFLICIILPVSPFSFPSFPPSFMLSSWFWSFTYDSVLSCQVMC